MQLLDGGHPQGSRRALQVDLSDPSPVSHQVEPVEQHDAGLCRSLLQRLRIAIDIGIGVQKAA